MSDGESEAGRTVLKRFENEARATAALRSPHTIEVYDFGLSNEGAFYYVMELLDGFDLDTLVTRFGPQPPERVVYLLRQACHSLDEAHLAGLVHRDIKPANLFTCRYGGDLDFLKVLDFGLVTERTIEGDEESKLTRRGAVVGSPAFMAPEMIEDLPLDGRADLYALACVAYWLLTGSLVFESNSAMGVLIKHAREAPRPPSELSEFAIPRALERIIMDCLEKDPALRPQTARELSNRLAEVRFEQDWTEERRIRWWQTQALTAPSPTTESPTTAVETTLAT